MLVMNDDNLMGLLQFFFLVFFGGGGFGGLGVVYILLTMSIHSYAA